MAAGEPCRGSSNAEDQRVDSCSGYDQHTSLFKFLYFSMTRTTTLLRDAALFTQLTEPKLMEEKRWEVGLLTRTECLTSFELTALRPVVRTIKDLMANNVGEDHCEN